MRYFMAHSKQVGAPKSYFGILKRLFGMDNSPEESGYTLQTLIIIAILVLGATVAFTTIYAILDDSTDNIVGGTEAPSGLPGPPRYVEHKILPPSNNEPENYANVEIFWEKPSYLGENQIEGFLVKLENEDLGSNECSAPENQLNCILPDIEVGEYSLTVEAELTNTNSFSKTLPVDIMIMKPADANKSQVLDVLVPTGILEFAVNSVDRGDLSLPQITITSSPCGSGNNEESDTTFFTFYWVQLGNSRAGGEISFRNCSNVLPINMLQNGDAYSIWGEAFNSTATNSEITQVSDRITWVVTDISIDEPAPPRNVRVFLEGSQDIILVWEPPEVRVNEFISDYQLSIYRNQCGEIPIEEKDLPGTRIPRLLIDTEGDKLCLEISAKSGAGNESVAVPVDAPQPSLIPDMHIPPSVMSSDRVDYSWISVNTEGDQATLTWRAMHPSEIAYFEIYNFATANQACDSTNTQIRSSKNVRPEPFGSANTFLETIKLFEGNNHLCILTMYKDGSAYVLRYYERNETTGHDTDISLTGEASGSSLSINRNSLVLNSGDGNTLDISGGIRSRYYIYYLCFEVRNPGDDNFDDSYNIRVRIENNNAPEGSNASITPDGTGFTYDAIVPDTTSAGTGTGEYQVQAWVSNDISCPHNAASASISNPVMIS